MAGAKLKRIGILVFTTLFGAVVGFGTSYTQTPLWQSSAQFEPPKVLELGNYFSLFSTYQFLNGNQAQQGYEQAAITYAYDEFKRNLTSEDRLREFLAQQEIIKLIAQVEHKNTNIVIEQLVHQFHWADHSLSLTLSNPEQAQQLLSGFIAFANAHTRQTLNDDLILKWKNLFGLIKNAAETKLGATQQGEQIVAQDWQGKLTLMRSVAPLDDKLIAYRLLKSPTLPLKPVSPARELWLAIGAAVGLLLGLILAFALPSKPVQTVRNTENVS